LNPLRWRVDLALVSVALVWGTTFVLVKQALADISTLLFLTLRFAVAALALGLLLNKRLRSDLAEPLLRSRSIRAGVLAGVFLAGGYLFQTFGLKYTTPAKAGFLTGLYIPLVPLFGAMVYKKAPNASELVGVVCAFAGMALMTVERNLGGVGGGDVLVMICAVAYAFHILVLGRFAADSSVAIMSVVQIATAALLGAATCWWAEPVHVVWTSPVVLALGITSLFATALAFSIQTWAQQYSSPTRTALIFSLEPVFAWATSYVVADEVLSGRAMLGAALIMAGILTVELKPFQRRIPAGQVASS
ncbi:MAG: DMT family transporter, partial [Acidobacteriota bacterium]|nr:DMT family transporter [Acidobacteriota bacterium]